MSHSSTDESAPLNHRRDQRRYQRLALRLPLRVLRIAGQQLRGPRLVTADISSSGVRFEAPLDLDVDTPVEMAIELLDGPLGGRRLEMCTEAHVVRSAPALRPGWNQVAVTFDEIRFHRRDPQPAPADSADAAA